MHSTLRLLQFEHGCCLSHFTFRCAQITQETSRGFRGVDRIGDSFLVSSMSSDQGDFCPQGRFQCFNSVRKEYAALFQTDAADKGGLENHGSILKWITLHSFGLASGSMRSKQVKHSLLNTQVELMSQETRLHTLDVIVDRYSMLVVFGSSGFRQLLVVR